MNLDIKKPYYITGYTYIPLVDSFGTCCDNCGKLLANIVYIKDDEQKNYIVGIDCAKRLTSIDKDDVKRTEIGIKSINSFLKKLDKAKQPFIYGNMLYDFVDTDWCSKKLDKCFVSPVCNSIPKDNLTQSNILKYWIDDIDGLYKLYPNSINLQGFYKNLLSK